jgi:hypothetical protein
MTDQYTTIENVEIEFFHGTEEDGDYYITNFIYPPCDFFDPNMVTFEDTRYHKDSVYVKSKIDGTLSKTDPLHWKSVPVPTRGIVKVKRTSDGTLFADTVVITDGDVSILAANSRPPDTRDPRFPTREEVHERDDFIYRYPSSRNGSVTPPIR